MKVWPPIFRGARAFGVLAWAFRTHELFSVCRKLSGAPRTKSSSSRNAKTSTPQACAPRNIASLRAGRMVTLAATLAFASASVAQETPTPSPTSTPQPRNVRISFLPPPLEGTISLGIYDEKGKLVRVLHREADIDEFEIGHDALITSWDGKNDTDEPLPPGKYSAHGYAVGDLEIEGRGYFFNDWVTRDDSPHVRHLRSLKVCDNELVLDADLVSEGLCEVLYDQRADALALGPPPNCAEPFRPPPPPAMVNALVEPVMAVLGKDDTRWVIDHIEKDSPATVLKQFADDGEFIRALNSTPGDPQPRAVAASRKEDKIYLLEDNGAMQRMRALVLVATKTDGGAQPVSEWKVDFEKKTVPHPDFAVVDGVPVASAANAKPLQDRVSIRLQPNLLSGDPASKVEVSVGFDTNGSFLQTADGLPLCTISETPHLTRAVITAAGAKAVDVFEDDTAVVEQFRVSGVDRMMSFDCGGFELK